MTNYSNELIPGLTYDKDNKILVLAYESYLNELKTTFPKVISTPELIEFMRSLRGKNKSGSKNGIGRLQYFINAYLQESALVNANPGILDFYGNNHEYLARGESGDDDPDLKLTTDEGIFKVEVKKYWNQKSYLDHLHSKDGINFHDSTYALVYLVEGGWRVTLQREGYEILHFVTDLASTDPWIAFLKLPTKIGNIKFNVDNNFTDDQVPEEVTFALYL